MSFRDFSHEILHRVTHTLPLSGIFRFFQTADKPERLDGPRFAALCIAEGLRRGFCRRYLKSDCSCRAAETGMAVAADAVRASDLPRGVRLHSHRKVFGLYWSTFLCPSSLLSSRQQADRDTNSRRTDRISILKTFGCCGTVVSKVWKHQQRLSLSKLWFFRANRPWLHETQRFHSACQTVLSEPQVRNLFWTLPWEPDWKSCDWSTALDHLHIWSPSSVNRNCKMHSLLKQIDI